MNLLNQNYLVVIIIVFNLLIFSFLKQQHYFSEQAYFKEIFNLIALAVLFCSAPLTVSFGVYFTLWHSLGSILDPVKFIHQYDPDFSLKTFYRQVDLLTLLSIFLFAIAEFILSQFNLHLFNSTVLMGLFFISLATITLPPALTRENLYQKWPANLISSLNF
jgi:Brp/Blh family beta-carotene 15,15'-monooxygenase